VALSFHKGFAVCSRCKPQTSYLQVLPTHQNFSTVTALLIPEEYAALVVGRVPSLQFLRLRKVCTPVSASSRLSLSHLPKERHTIVSSRMEGQIQPLPLATFSWELCADLHNRIIDAGWSVLLEETDYEPSTDSWWEDHFGTASDDGSEDGLEESSTDGGQTNSEAEELERRLHPDVIRFLKRARHDYPGTESDCNFFYYLKGLVQPSDICWVLYDDPSSGLSLGQRDRYVWLYWLTTYEPGGLV
jgi:hypothetical protein